MYFRPLLLPALTLILTATAVRSQDASLPLPEGDFGTMSNGYSMANASDAGSFLKPTKSIKPPAAAQGSAAVTMAQPQVNAPTARLRRLILMPGTLGPEAMRETMLAGGQSLTPVTVVGMNAPAPVLSNLAAFFGDNVTEVTQKKLLDTVRKGMTHGAKTPGRVEVVGWMPSQGVMAVAIYPES